MKSIASTNLRDIHEWVSSEASRASRYLFVGEYPPDEERIQLSQEGTQMMAFVRDLPQ